MDMRLCGDCGRQTVAPGQPCNKCGAWQRERVEGQAVRTRPGDVSAITAPKAEGPYASTDVTRAIEGSAAPGVPDSPALSAEGEARTLLNVRLKQIAHALRQTALVATLMSDRVRKHLHGYANDRDYLSRSAKEERTP